jgi:hypothetical protein
MKESVSWPCRTDQQEIFPLAGARSSATAEDQGGADLESAWALTDSETLQMLMSCSALQACIGAAVMAARRQMTGGLKTSDGAMVTVQ